MKLPIIDGKEIIPVRLIPLITHGVIGQDILPGILANILEISGWPYDSDSDQIEISVYDATTDSTSRTMITRSEIIGPQQRDNGICAYYLKENCTPVQMQPRDWENIYREIIVLESVLRKNDEKIGVPNSMEFPWRLKATKILPPGVFLWRSDFDLLWQAHINSFSVPKKYNHSDFREVDFDLYVSPEYYSLVLEGIQADIEVVHEPVDKSKPLININKPKDKAPITKVINSFLDSKPTKDNMVVFYEYVRSQLARNKNGEMCDISPFPVDKITTGVSKGLRMVDRKEGAKSFEERDYHYTHKEIGERLSKEKTKRKTLK